MATTDKPLPFPGDSSPPRQPTPPSRHHHQHHQYDPEPSSSASAPTRHARTDSLPFSRPSGEFYSTTTAPLRDDSTDDLIDRPIRRQFQPQQHAEPSQSQQRATTHRPRTASNGSVSVLDRGRPKPARPSSFFGADPNDYADDTASRRTSGEWGAATAGERASNDWARGGGAAGEGDDSDFESGNIGGGARGRAGSFFGVPASPGAEDGYAVGGGGARGGQDATLDGGDSSTGGGGAGQQGGHGRRSSFYGLDSHVPSPSGDYSPSNQHHPSSSNTTNPHQQDSGSGSFSSHSDIPRSGPTSTNPRYYNAPYAASHAGSLYGMPNSNSNSGGRATPAATDNASLHGGGGAGGSAPLLDQSHLRPGVLAALLSHEKTLDLYRINAKKTNDPDIQFEFCTFTMEVVGEMDAAELAVAGGGEVDQASKVKKQELVAESVALLNKLATRGHVRSQYFLADCYTQGVGTVKGKRDYNKAFPLFVLAGKHGHSDACFRAAQCCENAWGCKRDFGKAVSLLRRAAVLNHPGAMHRLGVAELNGELGLSNRPREGVKWLKRAAELADQVDPPQPQSLHELAILHENGIENVVFQDEEYAAELLARAAELHYAPSAYKLGECYEYGKMGCPQDSALSIHYYNIAAQQQHREACFALTAWYLVGSPGVLPQSDTEAYLWARKAADLELAKAEYAVGYFTESGIGTHKDAREALDWFRKAAGHGDKRAMDRLRMASHNPTQPLPFPRSNNPNFNSSDPPPPPPPGAYKPPPMTIMKNKMMKGKNNKNRTASASGEPFSGAGGGAGAGGRPTGMGRQRSNSLPSSTSNGGGGANPYAAYDLPPVPGPPTKTRMPMRQGGGGGLAGSDGAEGERRERATLRRGGQQGGGQGGGKGEDKDCVIS